MTDTVKLIIEIPKERELIDKAIWYDVSDFDTEDLAIILTALKNGVPLDDVKALEQEPCEDCISRQAVRHILNHEVKMPIKVWKKLFELVDCLPPVTPKPKTGQWEGVMCSNCKVNRGMYGDAPKYCPNCGAKMESEDKE